MYTDKSISLLLNRIKWHTPLEKEYADILEEEILTSGIEEKAYQDIHKLVSIENIHCTQSVEGIKEDVFNKLLKRMDSTNVKKVLEDVFDNNKRAIQKVDYDSVIEENVHLFDNALKLYMAVQVVQMIISTTRSNLNERILKLSYQKLKVELEGAKNDFGKVISVGLSFKYSKAINTIINILFPVETEVKIKSVNAW